MNDNLYEFAYLKRAGNAIKIIYFSGYWVIDWYICLMIGMCFWNWSVISVVLRIGVYYAQLLSLW
jgi:hypothetical protein